MGHRFATELQQQLQLQLATIQCTKFAFVDARVRRAFRVLLHNAGNFAIVSDERHYFVTRRRCRQSVIQQLMSFLQAFNKLLHFNKLCLCLQVGLLATPFGCCTCFSVCCYGWQMMLHHRDKELDRRRHVNTQLQFATVFSVLRTKMTKLMRLVLLVFTSFALFTRIMFRVCLVH